MAKKQPLNPEGAAAALVENPALLANFLYYLDSDLHEFIGAYEYLGAVKLVTALRQCAAMLREAKYGIIRQSRGDIEVHEGDRNAKKLIIAFACNGRMPELLEALAELCQGKLKMYFKSAKTFFVYSLKLVERMRINK